MRILRRRERGHLSRHLVLHMFSGTAIADINAKMPDFLSNFLPPESTSTIVYDFQPLKDIHLQSNLAREIKPNGEGLYIKIFFLINGI